MTNPIYVIICGGREPYIAERDIEHSTRERTVADLAAGEWGAIDGNRFMVSSIIELETGADRTDEFIELAKHQMEAVRPPNVAEWNADRARAIQAAE
jgi:hypothetical protein